MTLSPEAIAEAQHAAGVIHEEARRLAALAWALDSALSLRRKAHPDSGYRGNPVLGDSARNVEEYDGAIARAYRKAVPDTIRLGGVVGRGGFAVARVDLVLYGLAQT